MYRFVIVQLGFPVYAYESETEDGEKHVFDVAEGMGLKEFYLQIFYRNQLVQTAKITRTP